MMVAKLAEALKYISVQTSAYISQIAPRLISSAEAMVGRPVLLPYEWGKLGRDSETLESQPPHFTLFVNLVLTSRPLHFFM